MHTHIHTTIYTRTESSSNSSNAADIAYHHVVVCKRGLISCFGNLRGNYSSRARKGTPLNPSPLAR